ncbi:Innexin inx2 [Chionoecetes opilio]|uniref:Innexin n=1 Tax=Chionoecetes opilio TaxID=41210 RepID=A0A8J4YH71_CHIOP|nr:Innexin inx2 [Chionoecetes opilio]
MYYILRDNIRQLLNINTIKIDNIFFFLHYKITMVLLVVFGLLVTKKQYFGDPIDCIVEAINSDTIDMYCWIQSTYTIPELTGAIVGEEVAHPGVANYGAIKHGKGGTESYAIKHHKYYQWVVLFLSLQAFMFYLPRFIWKTWEGGRVGSLVGELHQPVGDNTLRQQRLAVAVEYFTRYLHHHNLYAFQFFFCEILNFANIIGQIYFTDRFLDYGFLNYGPRVSDYATTADLAGHDPKDEIFPKVAKCTFHMFGPSGTIMRHDALCVLPLNILNEKIFAFLWYWFVLVAVVSGLGLVYRLATFLPTFRTWLLNGRSRLVAKEKINSISRRCYIGDWFILYLIAKNMDAFVYRDFIQELSESLADEDKVS